MYNCIICLEDINNKCNNVFYTPCFHKFHINCIIPWIKQNIIDYNYFNENDSNLIISCPICRTDITNALETCENKYIQRSIKNININNMNDNTISDNMNDNTISDNMNDNTISDNMNDNTISDNMNDNNTVQSEINYNFINKIKGYINNITYEYNKIFTSINKIDYIIKKYTINNNYKIFSYNKIVKYNKNI